MQTYELPRVKTLPDIIPVDYKYFGDRRPQANIPENFSKDFPNYVWNRFTRLKKSLNDKKEELDKFVDTPEKSKKFGFVTLHAKSLMSLKQNKMITEYNSEIKSNAFLKLYEILRWLKTYNYLDFYDSAKSLKSPNSSISKIIKTLSVAEAPGNFILALNHFIKTECPDINWEWRASTFKTVSDESFYLSDAYGIIKRFPDNWIYGVDGDGDITSVNNLESFYYENSDSTQTKIEETKKSKPENSKSGNPKLGNQKKYNIVTSDVKYVPIDNIYSEEETINIPVITGHTLASILNLEKGGIAILKEFSLFECGTISLLYLLSYCFDKVYITKPMSSKQANSEVYIVCTGYLDNLNFGQIKQLKTYLTWIRFLVKPKKNMVLPALFTEYDIEENWITELIKINKDLTERQIKELDEMVEIVEKYQKNPHLNAQNDFRLTNERLEDKWIKENQVKRLDDKDKMLISNYSNSSNSTNYLNGKTGGFNSRNNCDCGNDIICVHKNQIRAMLNAKSEYFRKTFLTILSHYLTGEKIEELLTMYRQKSDTELYDFIIKNTKAEYPSDSKLISPEKLIKYNQTGDLTIFSSDIELEEEPEKTEKPKTIKLERFYLNDARLKELIFHIFDSASDNIQNTQNQRIKLILKDTDVDVIKSKNSQLIFDILNILKHYKTGDLRPIYTVFRYPRSNTEKLISEIVENFNNSKIGSTETSVSLDNQDNQQKKNKKLKIQVKQQNRDFNVQIDNFQN